MQSYTFVAVLYMYNTSLFVAELYMYNTNSYAAELYTINTFLPIAVLLVLILEKKNNYSIGVILTVCEKLHL